MKYHLFVLDFLSAGGFFCRKMEFCKLLYSTVMAVVTLTFYGAYLSRWVGSWCDRILRGGLSSYPSILPFSFSQVVYSVSSMTPSSSLLAARPLLAKHLPQHSDCHCIIIIIGFIMSISVHRNSSSSWFIHFLATKAQGNLHWNNISCSHWISFNQCPMTL